MQFYARAQEHYKQVNEAKQEEGQDARGQKRGRSGGDGYGSRGGGRGRGGRGGGRGAWRPAAASGASAGGSRPRAHAVSYERVRRCARLPHVVTLEVWGGGG